MTIQQIMTKVPGNQFVDIREYIHDKRLVLITANDYCETLRYKSDQNFDVRWIVYNISVVNGILTVSICPPV